MQSDIDSLGDKFVRCFGKPCSNFVQINSKFDDSDSDSDEDEDDSLFVSHNVQLSQNKKDWKLNLGDL